MHRGGNYNDSISSKLNSNLKIENNKGKNLKSKKSPFSLASSKNRSSASLDRLASVFCNLRNEQAQQEENVTCGSKVDLTSNNETNKTNKIDSEVKKQDSFESQVITSGSKNQVNNAWSISRKVSKLAKERKAAKTLGMLDDFTEKVCNLIPISYSFFSIEKTSLSDRHSNGCIYCKFLIKYYFLLRVNKFDFYFS